MGRWGAVEPAATRERDGAARDKHNHLGDLPPDARGPHATEGEHDPATHRVAGAHQQRCCRARASQPHAAPDIHMSLMHSVLEAVPAMSLYQEWCVA